MVKFKGTPNMLVRFNPPIGNLKGIRFDENGEFATDNERVINRFKHKFDSVPVNEEKETIEVVKEIKTYEHKCKKCDYSTNNKGELMVHYRTDHPKGDDK